MANLEDLIDPEYGLQQDEWSLTRPKFGEEGQLEVIGWSGKSKEGRKLYLVSCRLCSGDAELFGSGIFKSAKNNLDSGQIPCACSKRYLWNEAQILVRIQRKIVGTGVKFNKFLEYMGLNKTRCELVCEKHGPWQPLITSTLLKNSSCPICNRTRPFKTDDVICKKFMNTGKYAEGTIFKRNDKRKTSQGYYTYWDVYCPVCDYKYVSGHSSLLIGCVGCMCSRENQKQSYITLVKDNQNIIALKFGITNNHTRRIKSQAESSIYNLNSHGVWYFDTKRDCRAAERECKQTLDCGVLTKEEMPDGYTETTWVYNLEKIVSIYEKHGGVRIEDVSNNLET